MKTTSFNQESLVGAYKSLGYEVDQHQDLKGCVRMKTLRAGKIRIIYISEDGVAFLRKNHERRNTEGEEKQVNSRTEKSEVSSES